MFEHVTKKKNKISLKTATERRKRQLLRRTEADKEDKEW